MRNLHGKKLLQYIWVYYKLPLAAAAIILYILVYMLYGHLTHKETYLYTAYINVSAGDNLLLTLSDDFLSEQSVDADHYEVYQYTGLFLTENTNSETHPYVYASRMKILAAIDAEQMDIVLMNEEAMEAFHEAGYLCDLEQLLSDFIPTDEASSLFSEFQENLTSIGTLDISETPAIISAGFNDRIYLGIIDNSPRKKEAFTFIKYLYTKDAQQ